ncbi:hypothetical protein LF1_13210 [Rubripirellula obstinata]|uniref:Uncharacterized protein n=2 Tax=Rubripirellula obstinata TaxID=406547 RepID=A0A5B1CC92_9BACT|nr:hypothetical protein [Rubripirellula obstinata]KAA1258798.1 hypothetical protein LF1_13210 [Rubripirellula obstinata]
MYRRLAVCYAALTVLVLFGFPKAGIYLGNIPLTFSYVLVGIAAVFELVCLTRHPSRKLHTRYAWLGVLIGLLALLEIASFRIYGMRSVGAAVSVLVSTIAMPILAILMTHWVLRILGIEGLLRFLKWAMVPVFAFGFVSFLVYNATGTVLGIPFITTTGSDITTVATRHNLRGPVIKMFSTYNNGNILGINLLMWGPLVAIGSFRGSMAYRSLCVATLSRSVWAGLVLLELIKAMSERSYRRVFQAACGMVFLLAVVIVASYVIGRDPQSFLLDKDLGGRVTNLQNDLEVISSVRIGWDSESVPAAAWLAFGPAGVVLMAIVWLFPVLTGGNTKVQITARISMLVYLIVAVVEGAFILVPTQAIYWFIASLAMAAPEITLLEEPASETEEQQPERTDLDSVEPPQYAPSL